MVLSTVGTESDAEQIGKRLLDETLAACVQIEGPIKSYYCWKGKQCCDTEFRLVIKTSGHVYQKLKERLTKIHPYDEPQVVAFEAVDAAEGYGRWVEEVTAC